MIIAGGCTRQFTFRFTWTRAFCHGWIILSRVRYHTRDAGPACDRRNRWRCSIEIDTLPRSGERDNIIDLFTRPASKPSEVNAYLCSAPHQGLTRDRRLSYADNLQIPRSRVTTDSGAERNKSISRERKKPLREGIASRAENLFRPNNKLRARERIDI